MILTLLTYIVVGIAAGFFAGLLGIGGGLIIVPALIFCFEGCSVDQTIIVHLALGTSMACIIFTSISSCFAHNKKKQFCGKYLEKVFLGY